LENLEVPHLLPLRQVPEALEFFMREFQGRHAEERNHRRNSGNARINGRIFCNCRGNSPSPPWAMCLATRRLRHFNFSTELGPEPCDGEIWTLSLEGDPPATEQLTTNSINDLEPEWGEVVP
jgi:hypothetical protein